MDIEYANSKMAQIINEYVHSERDREILLDRYINDYSYMQLFNKYDLSVRRIQTIDYKFRQNILLKHRDELM